MTNDHCEFSNQYKIKWLSIPIQNVSLGKIGIHAKATDRKNKWWINRDI